MELAPGSAISEAELSRLLGMSRTPIRAALQRLARNYLVTVWPRRGIVISDININNQLKALEVRREMERLLTRLAAERATPAQREKFLELADAMEETANRKESLEFFRLDHSFNELVATAAQNEIAASAVQMTHTVSRRFWYFHNEPVRNEEVTKAATLHATVAREIAGGDPARAAQASNDLMDYVEGFTRATISRHGVAASFDRGDSSAEAAYAERETSAVG